MFVIFVQFYSIELNGDKNTKGDIIIFTEKYWSVAFFFYFLLLLLYFLAINFRSINLIVSLSHLFFFFPQSNVWAMELVILSSFSFFFKNTNRCMYVTVCVPSMCLLSVRHWFVRPHCTFIFPNSCVLFYNREYLYCCKQWDTYF